MAGFYGAYLAVLAENSVILNDTFVRANANPIGAPYATIASHSAIQIVSDVACGSATATICDVGDTTHAYPNNQFARVTVGTIAVAGSEIILILRSTPASDAFISWTITEGSTTTAFAYRTNSTTSGSLGTPTLNTTPAGGDIYELGAFGQVYYGKQNNAVVFSITDGSANLSSGGPGLGFNPTTAVGNSTATLFQAG